MVKTHYLLSERFVPIAVIEKSTLLKVLPTLHCRRNKPFLVILSRRKNTPHQLQELFTVNRCSQARWLLFLDAPLNTVQNYLDIVNIPFDCEFLVASEPHGIEQQVELAEVYRVNGTLPLRTPRWGNWSRLRGLQASTDGIYVRRNNLEGLEIRAAFWNSPPYASSENGVYGGFFYNIYHALEEKLNFRLKIIPASSRSRGSPTKNGSWTGMVGMMLSGKVDTALNHVHLSNKRAGVIDLIAPILSSRLCLFVRPLKHSNTKWSQFFSPFSVPLWLAVCGFMLLATCCLMVLNRLKVQNVFVKDTSSLQTSLLDVWTILLGQVLPVLPTSSSARLVYWIVFTTSTMILCSYCGNCTSLLAAPKSTLPFTNLQGLLENNEYEFGVLAEEATFMSFMSATDGIMRKIYRKKLLPKRSSLPKNPLQGLLRACKEKFVYMVSYYNYMELRGKLPCDLVALPGDRSPVSVSLPFRKSSPYRGIINFTLRKMMRSGMIGRLYLSDIDQPPRAGTEEIIRSVQLSDIYPVLALGALATLFSAIFLLLEICIAR